MSGPNGPGLTALLAGCRDVSGIGLRALLNADPRFTIVGETRGDVVQQAQRLQPDVIVLDVVDGGRPNLALIGELTECAPQSHVCVYTNQLEPHTILDMMVAGARSCVLKADVDGAFVADTLAMVGRYGATVIDPAVSTRFRAEAGYRLRLMPDAPADQRLSERERAVLRLLADGCAGQAAAARLGISDSTVRSYIGRACAKLGATTREQLMVLATRQWDNPYQVPQLSYNKVKSFVTTTGAGSYAPPTGTVQALTWTYVPGCYTFNFSFAYDRVTFGSRWDAFFGYYETTWWHFLP